MNKDAGRIYVHVAESGSRIFNQDRVGAAASRSRFIRIRLDSPSRAIFTLHLCRSTAARVTKSSTTGVDIALARPTSLFVQFTGVGRLSCRLSGGYDACAGIQRCHGRSIFRHEPIRQYCASVFRPAVDRPAMHQSAGGRKRGLRSDISASQGRQNAAGNCSVTVSILCAWRHTLALTS